jgi:outer membrane protein assembly factor BamA
MLFAAALVALDAGTAHGQASTAAPTIRAIVIDRGEVFDSVEAKRFWGFSLVNVLHARTRLYVVQRELLFAVGQPYDTARANESARNLRALSIFRDVDIDTVSTDSGVVVHVRTTDGWTTNLGFGIRTSGTQRVINAFVQEVNLLGTRTIATLGYESDPDRSSVLVGFDTPRLISNRVGVGASYSRRSDGHSAGAALSYPFFSLSSRQGGSLSWGLFDGRVLHYEGGTRVVADSAHRKFALVRADGAVALAASARGFVRVGLTGQILRDDFGEQGGSDELPRTVRVAAGPYLSLRRPHYIQVRNYEAMARVEDVDLGPSVRVDIAAAPRAWGYDAGGGVGGRLAASAGFPFPTGFAEVGATVSGLRSSAARDSSTLEASALAVAQPNALHLLVGRVAAGKIENQPFATEYDIGLGYGIRAFPSHAFTGDRYYLVNGEYRWLVLPRFLGLVGLGVAGFVDHGGAWFDGEDRRTGTDVGFGFRIGSIRSAGSIIGRLDFAYRFENDREPAGWVVSLGRGFGWQRF